MALLLPVKDLQPEEQTLLLKALFHAGRMEEFNARWIQFQAEKLPDAELPLYRATGDMVGGSTQEAGAGRLVLQKAGEDPQHRVLANRLELFACARLNDVAGYGTALTALETLHEDRVPDHPRYWLLLAQSGRKEEGKQLASAYAGQPHSVDEYIVLGRGYQELGLTQLAQRCFRALIVAHPQAERAWLAYAAFLTESRGWDDLMRLAVQMRTEARLEQRLLGFSYYLEGWAEHELDRESTAEEAFRKMPQVWVGYDSLVPPAAGNLIRMGYAGRAGELLAKFESELETQPGYWEAQFQTANALKDPALLLRAAEKEFKLLPDNPDTENRYAAALLINRAQPDLAARLTLKLMSTYPDSAGARISHGFALLLNHRPREAWALLSKLRGQTRSPEQASSLALGLFQVHYQLGEYEQAWEMADEINPKFLFPTDLAWLEEARKKMPPRAGKN
jgi:tetratricopeptide (TPR) repeat protein